MNKLSSPAKLYIRATILIGAALLIWQLGQLRGADLGLTLAVSAVAAATQVFKVEGPTEKSSYNISWVAYAFAFVLLGPPAAVFVILVAHGVEWLKHKYPWYIQTFNITSYVIVASVTGLIYRWINGPQPPADLAGVAAVLSAMAAFTALNHFLIGLVLKLARGQRFAESGVFDRITLAIDFTLFGMGAGAALLWLFNPYAALLAAIPLYLIYTTLQVPALQRQTQTDPKTGLFNNRYFNEALGKELARADRYDRPLTVVMADLDLLRNINNTYGHLAGDVALIGIAQILKKLVRDYDIVARFGGEEFAILMPETTYDQAYPRVEEIRAAIEAARFDISTSLTPLRVTMSFGIAGREHFGQPPNEIIHSADLAVYQAKLTGRNRVCRYATGSTESVTTIPPLASELQPEMAEASLPPPADAPSRTRAGTPAKVAAQTRPSIPAIKPRPLWAIHVYIGGVILAALGLLALMFRSAPVLDWFGLGLFTVMILLTEWLAIDIYARDTSVSMAAAPLIAGAILFGPMGAIVLSVALAGAAWVKHRSPVSRFIFNTGNHLISGMMCVGLLRLPGRPFEAAPILIQVGVTVLAAGLVYLSSTSLLSGAIDLSSGQPFRQVWAERFRWLWPYYLALGVVAYAFVFSYLSDGLVGVVVTLVPLLMLRFSQAQYLDHTKTLVAQLRESNAELQKQADEISALNEELLLALSHAIDLRDPDVHGHSQNVARYAVLTAQELGLPPERVELVRKAGLLHDIGKLGIPEAILFKPARLTADEYEAVKQHVTLGAEIVDNCRSLHVLVPFIRHHHEHFDGQGYPNGLHNHEIPMEARILSVADAVEAMASDRPYRQGQDAEAILKEIVAHAGTQFDPMAVNAFVRMVQRKGPSVIVNSARQVHPIQWSVVSNATGPLSGAATQSEKSCQVGRLETGPGNDIPYPACPIASSLPAVLPRAVIEQAQ